MLSELLATPGVDEIHDEGSTIGVMALHGGLELGTYEIAQAVAGASGATMYAVVQPEEMRWHIPSISYDPSDSRHLRSFLAHVNVALSIHGFGRHGMRRTALIGGRNRTLGRRVAAALGRALDLRAVTDPDSIPAGLRGLHPDNPVNLPRRHGVQVELTADLRRGPVIAVIGRALAGALDPTPVAATAAAG